MDSATPPVTAAASAAADLSVQRMQSIMLS